jgi:hypothetical protein
LHAIHLESHRILLAATAALVLALVAAAAVPSMLGQLSSSDGGPATISAADPPTRAATPAWVSNPVASPIAGLRGE